MDYLNKKIMILTNNNVNYILIDKIINNNKTYYMVKNMENSSIDIISPMDIKDIKQL
jgi:predicted thioesterase